MMNVLRNVMWSGSRDPQGGPVQSELIAGKPYYVGPVSNGVTRNWKKGTTSIGISVVPCVIRICLCIACFDVATHRSRV